VVSFSSPLGWKSKAKPSVEGGKLDAVSGFGNPLRFGRGLSTIADARRRFWSRPCPTSVPSRNMVNSDQIGGEFG